MMLNIKMKIYMEKNIAKNGKRIKVNKKEKIEGEIK